MQAKLINRMEDLTALRSVWNRLYASVPDDAVTFASWDYIHAYVSFFKPAGWMVVVLHADGAPEVPLAIFPLELIEGPVGGTRLRICRSIGLEYSYCFDYLVAPSHRREALDALMALLRDTFGCDALAIERMHENSKNYPQLLESVPPRDRKIFSRKSTPFIDARSLTLEELSRGKKQSTFSDARRCLRRLEDLGPVQFLARTPDTATLDDFLRRHMEKFPDDHHFTYPGSRWRDFIKHLMGAEAYRGLWNYEELTVNGRPVSAGISFVGKGRKSYALSLYDETYRHCSPSKLHLYHLVLEAFAKRKILCLGPGLYPYKEDWCQAVAEVRFLWIFLTPRAHDTLAERAEIGIAGIFDTRPAG